MAPKSTSRKQTQQAQSSDAESSGAEAAQVQPRVREMAKNKQSSTAEKRQQLAQQFEQDMARVHGELDETAMAVEEHVSATHKDAHARLRELVERRGQIEAQIVKATRELEQAYSGANQELQAAAQGRLLDLQDGETEGHAEGVDGREVPSKKAVEKAEEMARKGLRA